MNLNKLSEYYCKLCENGAKARTQIEFLSLIELPPAGMACLVVTNNTIYVFTSKGCMPIDRISGNHDIIFEGKTIIVKGNGFFSTNMQNVQFCSHDLKLSAGCFTVASEKRDTIPQPKTV